MFALNPLSSVFIGTLLGCIGALTEKACLQNIAEVDACGSCTVAEINGPPPAGLTWGVLTASCQESDGPCKNCCVEVMNGASATPGVTGVTIENLTTGTRVQDVDPAGGGFIAEMNATAPCMETTNTFLCIEVGVYWSGSPNGGSLQCIRLDCFKCE